MNPPPDRYGHPRPRSPWKILGVTAAVVALVGCTIVTLFGIWIVLAMRNFGSNK